MIFEYLRTRRLRLAREAMECKGASVSEAAWQTGYKSPANFTTSFKRQIDISPRLVRARV